MNEPIMNNDYISENSQVEKGAGRAEQNKFLTFKRLGRIYAMQYLFQCDLQEEAYSAESLARFWLQTEEAGNYPDERVFRKARTYAEKMIAGVVEHHAAITETLERFSCKWDISRMSVVDRNIMRVAVYELQFCPDIPVLVSIDEAIEIGKEYGSEKSGNFINGILNGVKNSLPPNSKDSRNQKNK